MKKMKITEMAGIGLELEGDALQRHIAANYNVPKIKSMDFDTFADTMKLWGTPVDRIDKEGNKVKTIPRVFLPTDSEIKQVWKVLTGKDAPAKASNVEPKK